MMSNSASSTPDYAARLQAIYGLPSQAGFGSALFYEPAVPAEELESAAIKTYRHFVGELWERWGEATWMAPWKSVYRRSPGAERQVVGELQAIADRNVAAAVSMLLAIEDEAAARKALSDAYDDAAIAELSTYSIGDGAAMSGILLAGLRDSGEAIFLVFLID